MSIEYSLCPNSAVYVPSTIYVPMVLFMFLEDSLCPHSTVYVPRVQFMS